MNNHQSISDLNRAMGLIQAIIETCDNADIAPEKRAEVLQDAVKLIEPYTHYSHD